MNDETDNREVVTFLESDMPKLILIGSLSKRTRYTLRVDGPVAERELHNLISLIEAQIAVIADSGEAQP